MITTAVLISPNRTNSVGHMSHSMPLVGISLEYVRLSSLGLIVGGSCAGRGGSRLALSVNASGFFMREFLCRKRWADFGSETSKAKPDGTISVLEEKYRRVHVQSKLGI